eukprot:SAG31_NODE_399_length_16247_cov_19.137540_18_plen_160_part_00
MTFKCEFCHFPDAENKAVWEGLAEAREQKLARAIGVSHFSIAQLKSIMQLGKGKPAVNQCELSVGEHDDATIKFCQAHGITYESFGALRSVNLKDARLISIGAAHNVSTAQVALRFATQQGAGCPVAVSPGLHENYATEDLGLGSFNLSAAEMRILAGI